jgi:hypothetical protein
MSASEQPAEVAYGQAVQPIEDRPQRQNGPRPSLAGDQGDRKNEAVATGLHKAMEELVKAQDHLNSAKDHASETVSKALAALLDKVRGLQRELSELIHARRSQSNARS